MGNSRPVYKKNGWQYAGRFQFPILLEEEVGKLYFAYYESIFCFWDLPLDAPAGPFHKHSNTADKNE